MQTSPDRYHFFLHEIKDELSDEVSAGKMVIAGMNFPAGGEVPLLNQFGNLIMGLISTNN